MNEIKISDEARACLKDVLFIAGIEFASASMFNTAAEKIQLLLNQRDAELEALQKENEIIRQQLRSHIDLLQTLLEQFDSKADGTPDATPLDIFCNEMVGLYNSVMLKETRTLVQERDSLRKQNTELREAQATAISADSLVAAIEGNYVGMSHGHLVLTCQMLKRGRAAWRADAERMKPVIEHYLNRAKYLRDQSEIDRCEAALNMSNDDQALATQPEQPKE